MVPRQVMLVHTNTVEEKKILRINFSTILTLLMSHMYLCKVHVYLGNLIKIPVFFTAQVIPTNYLAQCTARCLF